MHRHDDDADRRASLVGLALARGGEAFREGCRTLRPEWFELARGWRELAKGVAL